MVRDKVWDMLTITLQCLANIVRRLCRPNGQAPPLGAQMRLRLAALLRLRYRCHRWRRRSAARPTDRCTAIAYDTLRHVALRLQLNGEADLVAAMFAHHFPALFSALFACSNRDERCRAAHSITLTLSLMHLCACALFASVRAVMCRLPALE